MHAIIMQGVLSGAFQKDEAGPTIAAGAALLAAHDDLDLLLRASAAFAHVYGCDPYSFATRLSRMAEDLGNCESVTL
jgi:uridylate kinase